MDPRTRLGLLMFAGIAGLCLESPLALGVLCMLSTAPMLAAGISAIWLRRGFAAAAAIVWGTCLSQGLFYAEQPRVPLFSLGPLTLWREGLIYGLAQSLRLLALSMAGLSMAVSTPPDRLLAALRALKVPSGLALMTSAALRFLPSVGQEILVVRRARAHRGRPVWKRTPWAWMMLEISLLRPVVARAWRRALTLAESLDARGFDPGAARIMRRPLKMNALDWVALGILGSTTAALATVRILHLLYVAEVIWWPSLRPVYAFVRVWL